jgi:GTP-binding protein HflX
LGAAEKPVLYVFSKIDAVPEPELTALQQRVRNLLPNSVFVSAVTEHGLEPLRRALMAAARKGTTIAELRLPVGDGKLLAQIYREADVIGQATNNGETVLRARLPESVAARLTRAGVKITHQ